LNVDALERHVKIMGIRNLVWVSGFMAVVALISKDGF
jgi:hypothetical protein